MDLLRSAELETWIGIAVFNSCHPYASVTYYSSDEFAFSMPQVSNTMSLTRFKQSLKRWYPVLWRIVDKAVTNAFILHKEYAKEPLSHATFMSKLADQLMTSVKECCHSGADSTATRITTQEAHQHRDPAQLIGQHFLSGIHASQGATLNPQRRCVLCLEKRPGINEEIHVRMSPL